MGKNRLAILGAALLIAVVAMASISRQNEHNDLPIHQLEPGGFYALEVRGERAEFELDFSNDARYVLALGSLGYSGKRHQITLESHEASNDSSPPAMRGYRMEQWKQSARLAPIQVEAINNETIDCSSKAADQETDSESESREFWLHVTDGSLDDPKHYTRVDAIRVAEGNRVQVFLDRQQNERELTPGLANEIVHLMDCDVLPNVEGKLGRFRDVDGDGKLAILLTPWLGRLQGGTTSLGGFVRGNDFRPNVEKPFGNACDMIYLNSRTQPGLHLRDLLAHEFTHVVCYSQRLGATYKGAIPDEEDWLNEAIAHLSEKGVTNLDYRISRFLNAPQEFPLVVPDYYHAGLWRNHGCRGATFLFLDWCAHRFGEDFVSALLRNPVSGRRNVEWASGRPFPDLFRQWSTQLYTSSMEIDSNEGTAHQSAQKDSSLVGRQQQPVWGPVGKWGLAGPRPVLWNMADPSKAIEIAGTAVAFIELRNHAISARRLIQIQGDWGTKLQVSLIKLPPAQARIRLERSVGTTPLKSHKIGIRNNENETADSTKDGTAELRVISEHHRPLQVEMLACEWHEGDKRGSRCWTGAQLEQLAVSARTIVNGEDIVRFRIPRGDINGHRWQIAKVIVRDSQQRRSVGWMTFEQEQPENSDAPLAQVAR